jgi:hypothetical protein
MTPDQEKRKIREAQVDIALAIVICLTWCAFCVQMLIWIFDLEEQTTWNRRSAPTAGKPATAPAIALTCEPLKPAQNWAWMRKSYTMATAAWACGLL